MKDGNIKTGAQTLFNLKTFWRLDVFQVDATEGRGNSLNKVNDFIGGTRINADWKTINAAELFKQQGFTFHHGHRAFGTDIA